MSSGPTSPAHPPKDFFVSYTGRDRTWAEWIAFTLEEAGYTTEIQAWDSRPGMNFVAMMHDATEQTKWTIAVLSEAYLESGFGLAEWAAAFRRDPTGSQRRLVPIRIEACEIQGLLGSIVYLDLVGLDEAQAKERLLAGVKPGRAKPLSAGFPESASSPKSGALVQERPLFPPSLPPLWNIPYPRNPYFTGREEVLDQLTDALRTGQPTALSQPAKDVHLQAISGLGGIGKTHVALEYAYRYRSDYQAVLWVQADTHENLTASFLAMAALLDLPEKETSESAQVVAAIQKWLQMTSGYLLILDNADDLTLARDFLPTKTSGHVLLTTRAQVTGSFARRLEVVTLPPEQGMLLLLHRAGLLGEDAPLEQAKETDRAIAQRLCEELGGLPLALDQAGAYIEETACGLAKYEHRYRRQRSTVLAERRGDLVKDHPLPVATTWNLSFEQVAQRNLVAADLLRVCAFLAPDAIPETIMTKGASQLGPHLAELGTDADGLDQAVETLRAYSLLRRDAAQETLSVHRLVQAVLKDQMAQEEQCQWAERVVKATNAAFPLVKHQTWSHCEVVLPHALVMVSLIEQYEMTMPEAARLLSQAAVYLYERARYAEAEPLYVRALAIREQQLGAEHPDTASSLNNLAGLYRALGKYAKAEPLYVRALAICEQQLGPEHPDTASSLNNLAVLYYHQGKYAGAEPLYVRALAIREQQLGPEHPNTASGLNNLATLYKSLGKYGEAEPLYVRALAIREQQLGPEHPDTATSLINLAGLYSVQKKYGEAEPLYVRALAIREQQVGPEHPDTATILNNLAALYESLGKYGEAEPLYVRALAIREQQVGPEHPDTAASLNNLAGLYYYQGKYREAEPLYVRALAICEQQVGPEHPNTASSLNNLAILYYHQGKYGEAEPLYVRALAICEQQVGPEHPDTASSLNNLAYLYRVQGKYREAEPLYVRALAICEQQVGPEHPDTASSLNNLAILYYHQGKYGEAEPLYVRALAIREQQLGAEHPDTASSLNNLAGLYRVQEKYREAELLSVRALAIFEQSLGQGHPLTQTVRENYAFLRQMMKREKKRRGQKRFFGLFGE